LPTYWYRVLGGETGTSEGTLSAATRREALQRLIDSGRHPLDLREQAERARGLGLRLGRRVVRLATFARQLATLSSCGVPIVKSLNVLIDQSHDERLKRVLTEIRESIQSGNTFAEALGRHPHLFPRLMVSMVAVGERAGTLDEQLFELSELYEREESLRGEVHAAVAYPVLVLTAGLVSAIVLITFFIPRLETLFTDVGQDLPAPTQVLLGISHFVVRFRWRLAAAVVVGIVGGKAALRRERVRFVFDAIKLRIPWLGALVRNLAVSRFTRLLGTLTHSGISLVDALDIAQPAIGNRVLAATVQTITARVRTGESLAALMGETDVFPPLSVQMVAVGEETGKMDQMLLRVADAYDRETRTSTKVMTSLLAPALILCVAGVVGFILVSMMLPIFQLSTVMR